MTEEFKKPWTDFELVPLSNLKGDFSLFDFQQWSVYQSLEKNPYILNLPTGTGKSFSSLAAFFYYRMIYPNTKLVIVTNNSSLYQFADEIPKFFNYSGKVSVFSQGMEVGGAETAEDKKYKNLRKKELISWGSLAADAPEILVMNYSILRLEYKNILQQIENLHSQQWNVFLILDEATSFMNSKTKVHKAVVKLREKCQKTLALTATLTKGRLEHAYFILKALGVNICTSDAAFEFNYVDYWQHEKHWWLKKRLGYKNIDKFRDAVIPYAVILRKCDVSDSLPAFTFQKIWLDHSPEQIELIQDIYSKVIPLSDGGKIDCCNMIDDINSPQFKEITALTEQGYLKRTLQAPELVLEKYAGKSSPKITEILRMLSEDFVDEKVIIYTPSKKFLKLLTASIEASSEVPDFYKKVVTICGDLSPEERNANRIAFTDSQDTNIMILDNVGGEALNLQAASVMILCSMPDTFGFLVQLAGRMSRIGSKHKNLLLCYLLHRDSQDEDEYRILMQQGIIFQAIHGEVEKGLLDTSLVKDLFSKDIPDSEYIDMSLSKLLLFTRKKRKAQYLKMG